ncbi:sugar phosphate isomerase/epimerase [Paenibacillus sp. P26]|nr:sugar phosphate isomerase/epimerase [Paenibacillus sp. P26]
MSRETWSRAAPMNVLYKFYSLPYFLDAAAANGFEAIELWGAAPHLYIDECTEADVKQLKRELAGRGLKVSCLTPESTLYPVNIAAEEPELRKRSIAYMLRALEIASELEIPLMQAVSGGGYYHEPAEEAWKRSRDSLDRIVTRAESLGIRISLEPLLPYESNLVNSLASARSMLEEIGSASLGIHLDTIAMEAAGDTLEEYFSALGRRILHVQLCDGPGGHLAWGDGTLPMKSYLQSLESRQYEGAIGLEMFDHKYYVDPDRVLKRCADEIRKAATSS